MTRKYWCEADEYAVVDDIVTEPRNLTIAQLDLRIEFLKKMFGEYVDSKLSAKELQELVELEKDNAKGNTNNSDADKERISFLKVRSDYHSLKEEKKFREDQEKNYGLFLDELSPELLNKFLLLAVEFVRPHEVEPLLARGADPHFLKKSQSEFKDEASQFKIDKCPPLGLIFELEEKFAQLSGRKNGEFRIFCHKDDDGKLKPKLVITHPNVQLALEQTLSTLERPVSLSEVGNRETNNLTGEFRRSVDSTRTYFNQGIPTKTPKTASGNLEIMPVINFSCDFEKLRGLLDGALSLQSAKAQSNSALRS